MATKAQLRQIVGEDLAIVPVGQDLEHQDVLRIDGAYGHVYERLKEEGLASWASTAEIPTKLVQYVALMVEEKLLLAYSVPDTRYARVKNDAGENGNLALSKIAELTVQEYESTDEVDDF